MLDIPYLGCARKWGKLAKNCEKVYLFFSENFVKKMHFCKQANKLRLGWCLQHWYENFSKLFSRNFAEIVWILYIKIQDFAKILFFSHNFGEKKIHFWKKFKIYVALVMLKLAEPRCLKHFAKWFCGSFAEIFLILYVRFKIQQFCENIGFFNHTSPFRNILQKKNNLGCCSNVETSWAKTGVSI